MKNGLRTILFLFATVVISYSIIRNERELDKLSNSSTITHQFRPIQSNPSYEIIFQRTQGIPKLNKEEILRKNVKGYREQTYWGSEHPIDEKVRDLNDRAFNDFIEDEIQSKDANVYWGAEY